LTCHDTTTPPSAPPRVSTPRECIVHRFKELINADLAIAVRVLVRRVVVPQYGCVLADSVPAVRVRRTVVMMMVSVMLRQQILTWLRQLTLMFAQAFADAPRAGGRITAERLHVTAARLLPRGELGLHLIQLLLAGRGQPTRVLL
jgi:hypothetical protein